MRQISIMEMGAKLELLSHANETTNHLKRSLKLQEDKAFFCKEGCMAWPLQKMKKLYEKSTEINM